MKLSWKTLILWSLPILFIGFSLWQGIIVPEQVDLGQNVASSRMTYGRFLEYLDMGWIKRVDLYDNGHTAIVEAVGPELGNRIQKIRVELPNSTQEVITLLRNAHVDLDAHPAQNSSAFWGFVSNLVPPLLLIGAVILLFRRSGNSSGANNSSFSFGKPKSLTQVKAKPGITFNDVAGVDEAKEEFKEVVTFLKKPETFTSVGARIPKGVLLMGPPGTGKTLLAKAVAGEAGVPFFSISGSEFVEMFVGVGASRVRDLFKKAKENAPCIVFIDEIDAVGRQRGTGIGGGNDEREQTLNQLLTEMDGFEGNTGIIVIAATNRVDILDSALLRPGRFDRQVTVETPNSKGREAILSVHAKNKKLDESISIEAIARRTPGFSGADLANLLNEAAILTARRKKSAISISEIDSSIDRVIAGMEGSTLIDGKSKRLVAYHEVGHAIIGTLLQCHDQVQKVTLIPRGQAKGLTWFAPNEDQMLVSRAQISARIIAALGGRAAEEIIFGNSEVTTGAGNDLQQVSNMARQMVTRFGMSDVGPLSLEGQSSDPFLGRSMGSRTEYSEGVATNIDSQIQLIVQSCYNEALRIIQKNRVVIDRIVDILIEKETVEAEEFVKLVSEYTCPPKIKRRRRVLLSV
uniref:ATP-dependent zinc metalloprotease FtsH n=1 Tax=Bangiopsis subsimplex TaxID=139980 RepID=A0A1C9CCS6_9RHOD|nr:cell division protein [Bangiopsis subsimplex]AOM66179.1 cell division protein [Bangiopsis subsimplex]ARO90461.1 probable ATP-dependent protease [Bangiopsis subsimplex]